MYPSSEKITPEPIEIGLREYELLLYEATITTDEIDFSVALTNLLLSWFVITHATNDANTINNK